MLHRWLSCYLFGVIVVKSKLTLQVNTRYNISWKSESYQKERQFSGTFLGTSEIDGCLFFRRGDIGTTVLKPQQVVNFSAIPRNVWSI